MPPGGVVSDASLDAISGTLERAIALPTKTGRTVDAQVLSQACGQQFRSRPITGQCDLHESPLPAESILRDHVPRDAISATLSGRTLWFTPSVLEDDSAMRDCLCRGEWTEMDRDSPEARRLLLQDSARRLREEADRVRRR